MAKTGRTQGSAPTKGLRRGGPLCPPRAFGEYQARGLGQRGRGMIPQKPPGAHRQIDGDNARSTAPARTVPEPRTYDLDARALYGRHVRWPLAGSVPVV